MRRVLLALMLPLLVIDCIGNVVVGESWRGTLSATAWRKREHRHWGWTHRAINGMFAWQQNHCRDAWAAEERYGGIWGAWRAAWGAT